MKQRLGAFQPKNTFLNQPEHSVEQIKSLMKDPSVEFQQIMKNAEYPVFTPNKIPLNSRSTKDNAMQLTFQNFQSTHSSRKLNANNGFDSGQRNRSQAAKMIQGKTTSQLNHSSQNVFATLNSSHIQNQNQESYQVIDHQQDQLGTNFGPKYSLSISTRVPINLGS